MTHFRRASSNRKMPYFRYGTDEVVGYMLTLTGELVLFELAEGGIYELPHGPGSITCSDAPAALQATLERVYRIPMTQNRIFLLGISEASNKTTFVAFTLITPTLLAVLEKTRIDARYKNVHLHPPELIHELKVIELHKELIRLTLEDQDVER